MQDWWYIWFVQKMWIDSHNLISYVWDSLKNENDNFKTNAMLEINSPATCSSYFDVRKWKQPHLSLVLTIYSVSYNSHWANIEFSLWITITLKTSKKPS